MERSLDVDKSRPLEIQTTTTEASRARNLFSSLELDRLRATFKEMITTSVPVLKPKVKEILQKEILQASDCLSCFQGYATARKKKYASCFDELIKALK